ncbi:MAG TPA: DEAD/DEAH box helicase, partial [Candidatus Gracilibacteria bacterium]|nr:DEAD/DEAH box helicase [Candidatus Gracilibacteria bacterium]
MEDLLLFFPRAYEDKRQFTSVAELRTDEVNNVKGTLGHVFHRRSRNGKALTRAILSDKSGAVEVLWFNQPFLQRILKNGQKIILSGKAKFAYGKTSLLNPSYEEVKEEQTHVGRLVPVYHQTEGISSKWIREKLKPLMEEWLNGLEEYIPREILEKYALMDYRKAVREAHFPTTENSLEEAKKRLGFDELFLLQLKALQKKWYWQNVEKHQQKPITEHPEMKGLIEALPFELTEAQKRTLREILSDLEKPYPMTRLLQGDVGSGKTVVAGAAIFCAIKAGYQTALMAPTEILTRQHYQTLFKLLHPYGFNIQFISGSTTASIKND